MRRAIFIILLLFIWLIKGNGESLETIPVGTRACGMGGAYTAVGTTPSGIYYNPAELIKIKNEMIEIMYVDLYNLSIINYTFIGYARPGIWRGILGISWLHTGTGDEFVLRNISEDRISLAYSFPVFDALNSGINIKFFTADYDGIKGTSWGMDISFIYFILKDTISVGLNAQNINFPVIKWGTDTEEKIDPDINVGAGIKLMEFIIFSLDVKNIITYKRRYSAGLEIEVLKRRIYLRAGASYQKVLTISGGCGIRLGEFCMEYAIQRHLELGWNNIFGVIINL